MDRPLPSRSKTIPLRLARLPARPGEGLPRKAEILRIIDLLALHKLNVLQLHLTDDQGWRMEIPRYPELTEIGNDSPIPAAREGQICLITRGRGRDRACTAERYVTVVPEMEMPGHSGTGHRILSGIGLPGPAVRSNSAWARKRPSRSLPTFWMRSWPQFPSPYIHMGADEVGAATLARLPHVQGANGCLGQGAFARRSDAGPSAQGPTHGLAFQKRTSADCRATSSGDRSAPAVQGAANGGLGRDSRRRTRSGDSRAVVMAWQSAEAIAGAAGQKHRT